MFISNDFVFLELHKTGCSHIRNILKELLSGDLVGGHNQANSNLFSEGRTFLGSIRDPWEWYTSLWAYGCDNKGGVFYSVTREIDTKCLSSRSRSPQKWKDTYKDVNDAEAFRAWLYMMHDTKHLMDIGEGYGASSVSRTAGLLTFRYLKLFCTKRGDSKKLDYLSTFDQIKSYENEFCFIDRFIRKESLESDLFRALEDFSVGISNDRKSEILSRKKNKRFLKKTWTRILL